MKHLLLTALALAMLPTAAQADLASVWVKGQGTYVNGTGDVYKRFDPSFTGGAEVGVHVLFLDLWADILAMDQSQALFSANLGPGFSFGDKLRLNIGAYASFMLFIFPEEEKTGPTGLQFTPQQRAALNQSGYDISMIESEYDKLEAAQEDVSNLGSGFAARARASVEYYFIPVMCLGVEGLVGYHWLLGGEEAAAGAKNEVIGQLAREQMLPGEVTDIIREAAGAEAIDKDALAGLHYQGGAYLKLKFGL